MQQQASFETIVEILQIPQKERQDFQILMLKQYFANIKFFKELQQNMGELMYEQCCKKLKLEIFQKNQKVFRYGDYGDKFYIIIKGTVGIIVPRDPVQGEKYLKAIKKKQNMTRRISNLSTLMFLKYQKEIKRQETNIPEVEFYEVVQFKAGFSFGEYALSKNAPRSATIECKEICYFGVMDKNDYKEIVEYMQ